ISVISIQCRKQRRQTIVKIVEAFDVVQNAFVNAQSAGGQRLCSRLVDLDQSPETQRTLRRQCVPGWLVENRQSKSESRIRFRLISLCERAKISNPRVQLHCRAKQKYLSLKSR